MSLKKTIENECKVCSYDSEVSGSWRAQVKGCLGVSCNLYIVRPLPIDESHDSRSSRRAAVDAHCKSCVYEQGGVGTWRAQVKSCTTTSCKLFSVRPLPIGDIAVENL
jgi:hypothetical protein